MRGSIREYVSDRKEPMMDTDFQIVGIRNTEDQIVSRHKKWYQGKPLISALLLVVILSGCLCSHLIMTKDPGYMVWHITMKHREESFSLGQIRWGEIFFP